MRRDGEKVYAPGIGDNSLGVAALFALAWELKARQSALPGDVWLVANVCEEGLGDLRGMNAVVERFGGGGDGLPDPGGHVAWDRFITAGWVCGATGSLPEPQAVIRGSILAVLRRSTSWQVWSSS